ncbi:MAG: cytochrome b N-terminal domain-containing protein [Thermoguttaceae bacterium]
MPCDFVQNKLFDYFMRDYLLIWLDERTGIPSLWNRIANWSVPLRRGCFGFLPTAIIFAFLLQAITGIFLWAFYSPSAQSAWESLFYIQFVLPGGWMIRGIHHYSAQLLTAALGFYLLGLVIKGNYRSPREFVFWSAVILFLFTLASSLTGDLLTWTSSGFSATLVRVRFLQMLPWIGDPLFRIVAGGPAFGSLTLLRFLVLHILVFGGGFFVVMLLWRYFDHVADSLENSKFSEKNRVLEKSSAAQKSPRMVSFWSNEVLKYSLVCLFFMAVVLLLIYQKPILHTIRPDWFKLNTLLPDTASLGASLGVPADTSPTGFYDGARPEWSFRALYQLSNLKSQSGDEVFPGEHKYLAIFILPGALMLYVLLIPIIGRPKVGHYFNMVAVTALFFAICYLTYSSYHHDYIDESMADFRKAENDAKLTAARTIELCMAPEGIPTSGALTLLAHDPFTQGPLLYERHCASCHPFHPLDMNPLVKDPKEYENVNPEFAPIPCQTPKGPNLYVPIRKKWISGFFDAKRLRSDDYFGKTKFRGGSMERFVANDLPGILEDEKEDNPHLLDDLITLLYDESKLPGPRAESAIGVEGLTKDQLQIIPTLSCEQCHIFYAQKQRPKVQAPDLRGYMSRNWMTGIIANPNSTRFYGPDTGGGKGNDGMPAFLDEGVMTVEEIETLADWLRGHWFRSKQSTPSSDNTDEKPNTKSDAPQQNAADSALAPLRS